MKEVNLLNTMMLSLTGMTLDGFINDSVALAKMDDEALQERVEECAESEDENGLLMAIADQGRREGS